MRKDSFVRCLSLAAVSLGAAGCGSVSPSATTASTVAPAPDPRVGANGLYQRTLTGDAGWCWAILSRRDCLDREDQPAGA